MDTIKSSLEKSVTKHDQDKGVVALGWQDLCGITRVRGLPLKDLDSKAKTGLSFPTCGQALNVAGGIVANRWGPIDDVRQIPVPATLIQVPSIGNYSGFNLVLTESVDTEGTPFECCTRQLFRSALQDLYDQTGYEFAAAFEHEFTLLREDFSPKLCMTLGALRALGELPDLLLLALDSAGVHMEAFEPEFGSGQYELSCSHYWGVDSADKAVITREVVRDIALHFGFSASFSPKIAPDQVGNGAHIHFSLRNNEGAHVLFDGSQQDCLSAAGGQFVAGIIRHINAIMPFAASLPVSYLRLGPSKWSAGFNAFGRGNREAVVRVCDLPLLDSNDRAASYNLEIRAADNACNPYLLLTMVVRAGLQGISENLPRPPSVSVDPATLAEDERRRLGIQSLPTSLEAALSCLEKDEKARSWIPDSLYETFVAIKENEIEEAKKLNDEELCDFYAKVY